MLSVIRNTISDFRFLHCIEKYKSKMGIAMAKPYARFHSECKAIYQSSAPDDSIEEAVLKFHDDGFATIWNPQLESLATAVLKKIKTQEAENQCPWSEDYLYQRDPWREFPEFESMFRAGVGAFLEGIYESHVKIYYGKLYKSIRSKPVPEGSQLWHSDGGPGTCTNLMIYLSEGTRENGAMEIIRWNDARLIFGDERAAMRKLKPVLASKSKMEARDVLTDWYKSQITSRNIEVLQPTGRPGTVLAFRNNTIHKGGFPDEGQSRYVIVLHIYPNQFPISYEKYRADGVQKTGAFPADPSF